MMKILEILFLLSITFPMITADDENLCLSSHCGNLSITHPFKLQYSQILDNCSYINLSCNEEHDTATINLPNAGDFYVRTIDYGYPFIQLYDTRDCLMMRRLMSNNFSFSSSPFTALVHPNYTFYSCSSYPNTTHEFYRIDCLSSPTNVTIARDSLLSQNVTDVCYEIGSKVLPILLSGDDHDLYLTWDSTSCPECEKSSLFPSIDPRYRGGDNSWEAPKEQDDPLDYSAYIMPAFLLIALVITVCSPLITRIMANKNEARAVDGLQLSAIATAAAAAPPSRGVEESGMISSCTEMVLSESIIISSGSDSRTCPICLESFEPRELSRSITRCGHCFHDECVVPWLIQRGTCPVCRIVISDS